MAFSPCRQQPIHRQIQGFRLHRPDHMAFAGLDLPFRLPACPTARRGRRAHTHTFFSLAAACALGAAFGTHERDAFFGQSSEVWLRAIQRMNSPASSRVVCFPHASCRVETTNQGRHNKNSTTHNNAPIAASQPRPDGVSIPGHCLTQRACGQSAMSRIPEQCWVE